MIALTSQLLGPGEAESKKRLTTSSFAILFLAVSLNMTGTNSNPSSPVLVTLCLLQGENLHSGSTAVFGRQIGRSPSWNSVHLLTIHTPMYTVCGLLIHTSVWCHQSLETESHASRELGLWDRFTKVMIPKHSSAGWSGNWCWEMVSAS